MTYVPASPGYSLVQLVDLYDDIDDLTRYEYPIVAWCVSAYTANPICLTEPVVCNRQVKGVLLPDGRVCDDGCVEYASLEEFYSTAKKRLAWRPDPSPTS